MIQGFNHYNLRAPRPLLDELRTFYCETVGLVVGDRPPFRSFGYWLYAGGRDILHLTECSANQQVSTNVATTFDHVAFSCTGLADVERRLKSRGVKYDVDHVPLAGQVQLFFSDPAGNGVELNFADDSAEGQA